LIDAAALDPITEIAFDDRVSPTAMRLYVLLRNGTSLEAAATALGRSTAWLKRYERQLCSLGYLEINTVRSAKGRDRRYTFPRPDPPGRLAS